MTAIWLTSVWLTLSVMWTEAGAHLLRLARETWLMGGQACSDQPLPRFMTKMVAKLHGSHRQVPDFPCSPRTENPVSHRAALGDIPVFPYLNVLTSNLSGGFQIRVILSGVGGVQIADVLSNLECMFTRCLWYLLVVSFLLPVTSAHNLHPSVSQAVLTWTHL